MARRSHDFYPTTETSAIDTLIKYWDIPKKSRIFECCYGQGHISKRLEAIGFENVQIGDIQDDQNYFDATDPHYWNLLSCDYSITNPPFNLAHEIIPLAYEYSPLGVAMLLRLSYLEPCHNRASWLQDHPISKLISVPRISFTGDGNTDQVSTAWFVWDKRLQKQEIIVVPPLKIWKY